MSKRIITNKNRSAYSTTCNKQNLNTFIRIYGTKIFPLYAVIIADDNLFEGL